jgi:tRNA1Val (adenine37-N6)-methyltransferase
MEIDRAAYEQTKENFNNSRWKDRLQAMHGDILSFETSMPEDRLYDLVISNPPFYENDLRSPSGEVNMARHDTTLTLETLVNKTKDLLMEAGLFSIMLPWHRVPAMLALASEIGLGLRSGLRVRQSPKHDFFRGMMLFEKSAESVSADWKELTIKETDHKYSLDFINYLQDYYLSL